MSQEILASFQAFNWLECLRQIVLDVGARPQAFCGKGRVFLHRDEDITVLQSDVDEVVKKAGIDANCKTGMVADTLHRISLTHPPLGGSPCGVALRMGRAIRGVCTLVSDVLRETEKSLIVLGPTGCGKTTVLRDMARVMAEEFKLVLVLDPGGEIGGTAAAVHSSLGLARRVPVPACKSQLSALSEAIENLSPDVVLVDRMQVDTAIAAARLCRDAGVRFVGTVLGSFQSCLHCLAEHVQSNGSRVSKRDVPVDALAEMPRCFAHAWKLVLDAAQAVEAFLAGTPPDVQIRERS